MKIVVSSQGENLDAPTSPVFGRCPTYLFVDTERMEFEAVPNPAMSQGGGAGIQAAQFVVNQGASVVLTGNLGPNAFDVLQAAGVSGYLVQEGTVRQAVEAYKAGQLRAMGSANVAAHAGMGSDSRRAAIGGRRAGAGSGSGAGVGAPAGQAPTAAREAELGELGDTLKNLRQQLAETMARIEELQAESNETKEG
jgi:predicted Fe-Mo cluster-binding NifX family protein